MFPIKLLHLINVKSVHHHSLKHFVQVMDMSNRTEFINMPRDLKFFSSFEFITGNIYKPPNLEKIRTISEYNV